MKRVAPDRLVALLRGEDPIAASLAELDAERAALEAIGRVARDGEAALRALHAEHGGGERPPAGGWRVPAADLEAAAAGLDPRARRSIARVHARHLVYARRQARALREFRYTEGGLTLGQRVVAAARVGFVLGERPDPGLVVALDALALAAGVAERCFAVPPAAATGAGADGATAPVLATLAAIGAREVHRLTGPAAVAAFATGVSAPAVERLIVATREPATARAGRAAARLVPAWTPARQAPILAIVAGAEALPELIAADVRAEREREPEGRSCVIATDAGLLDRVAERLAGEPTVLGAEAPSREAALDLADAVAPTRLMLHLPDAGRERRRQKRFASLFAGALTPPALADLGLGLPPPDLAPGGGPAAAFLSVLAFAAPRGVAHADRRGLARCRELALPLAALADRPAARDALRGRGGPRRVPRGIVPEPLRGDEGLAPR